MQFLKIPDGKEMIRFIEVFNHAFDCLNVRSLRDKNPARRGYTAIDDERFQASSTSHNHPIIMNNVFLGTEARKYFPTIS